MFKLEIEMLRCVEIFKYLATGFFSCQKQFFKLWISDSAYDADALEGILKDHFGPRQRMFDTPGSRTSGYRVAVTTSSIQDGTPLILLITRVQHHIEKNLHSIFTILI
jgi:hypothetical protein